MAAVEPREKVDRDELFLEITKSVCPVCKTVIDEPERSPPSTVDARGRCVDVKARGRRQPRERNRRLNRRKAEAL